MCTLLQQPGTSRYILLRDLRTGLDPILRSVHWTGWVPDVNSIRLFVHGMKALPGGHPRRAIPEVDHGVCHVQMLVPTVGNGFGMCVVAAAEELQRGAERPMDEEDAAAPVCSHEQDG